LVVSIDSVNNSGPLPVLRPGLHGFVNRDSLYYRRKHCPTRPITSVNFLDTTYELIWVLTRLGQWIKPVEPFAVLRFCRFQPNARFAIERVGQGISASNVTAIWALLSYRECSSSLFTTQWSEAINEIRLNVDGYSPPHERYHVNLADRLGKGLLFAIVSQVASNRMNFGLILGVILGEQQ
jgi:hypothetical protein